LLLQWRLFFWVSGAEGYVRKSRLRRCTARNGR
jgi:hypothetical protein